MENNEKKFAKWLSIQRARIGMFMKNHKYLSATIGLFVISAIIAVVVLASDEDPYEDTITATSNGDISVSSTAKADTATTRIAKSYSTVVYDIPYKLTPEEVLDDGNSNRITKITIKLDKTIDAEFFALNDGTEFQKTVDGQFNVYKTYDYANLGVDAVTKIYLNVYNIANGSVISPDITICESTATDDSKCFNANGDSTKITIESEELKLITKTVVGSPYSSGDDRYVPFGILVGIDSSQLTNGKLTGKYFNNNLSLALKATQATASSDGSIMLQKTDTDYYGLYEGETKGDAKISIPGYYPFPYSTLALGNETNSVFNSGSVTYSKCEAEECNLFGSDNVYTLNISDIKTNGSYFEYLGKGYVQDFNFVVDDTVIPTMSAKVGSNASNQSDRFLAIGSYYVTGIYDEQFIESDSDVWINLSVKYNDGTQDVDGLSYFSIDSPEKQVWLDSLITFESGGNESFDSIVVASGESVVLKAVTNYKIFNESNLSSQKYSLIGKIPVAAMTEINDFTLLEYNENLSSTPYYLSVGNSTQNLENYNVKVSYISCTTECSVDDEPTEETEYETFEAFNDAKEENAALKLSYVRYELSNVPASSAIDFRVKLLAGSSEYGETEAPVVIEVEDGLSNTYMPMISVTPYKARINMNIDSLGNDIRVNLSDKTNSTLVIYPSITAPASLINTNALQMSTIETTSVIVTLPNGINYVENNNYLRPSDASSDGKMLVYNLLDQKINSWLEPIYIDVSYDINVESNEPYVIKGLIGATTINDVGVSLSDISGGDACTAEVKVTFINTESLSYSLSSSSNAIGKDEEFEVIAKLYNRDTDAQSGLELVYVLPSNDGESSSFNGTYNVIVDENMMCTSVPYAIVNNSENLLNSSAITWEDCTEYIGQEAESVTAIKITNININSKEFFNNTIGIQPVGSDFSNFYQIDSYIITPNQKIKKMSTVKVSVESIKITGVVWEDFDGNGILSTSEFRVPDVELQLYDSETNELVKTTYSDREGKYVFDQISPENMENWQFYIVANYNTAKYALTQKGVGNDKSLYSSFSMVGSDDSECISIENRDENGNPINGSETTIPSEDLSGGNDENPPESTNEGGEEGVLAPDSTCQIMARTDNYTVTPDVHLIGDINLGLTPRKEYSIKLNKYISSATVTNALGISNTTDYGKVAFAKLDIKDIGNVTVKVTYSIEIKNTGYFPGYVYKVKDLIPDGMSFNSNYTENAGWTLSDNGYLIEILCWQVKRST